MTEILPGLLLYIGDGFFQYILVILVALSTSFLVTFIAYREKSSVEQPKLNYNIKHG